MPIATLPGAVTLPSSATIAICIMGFDVNHWHDVHVTSEREPALVPELLVSDLDRSMRFWCDLCGFTVSCSRLEERFAYITFGSAHVMLEQVGVGRNWLPGPLDPPLGRGINLKIGVPRRTGIGSTTTKKPAWCTSSSRTQTGSFYNFSPRWAIETPR